MKSKGYTTQFMKKPEFVRVYLPAAKHYAKGVGLHNLPAKCHPAQRPRLAGNWNDLRREN